MKTVEHMSTGTRHIVKETIAEEIRTRVGDGGEVEEYTIGNYKTECGNMAYGEPDWSPMLGEFPDMFGECWEDCERCTKTVEI